MRIRKLPLLCAALAIAACSDNTTLEPARDAKLQPAVNGVGGASSDLTPLATRAVPQAVLHHRMLLNSGGPDTYKMVIVRSGPGADKSTQAGAPVVDNFADAVSRTAPGGTIRVMAGAYDVSDVIIDRPLTIEPFNSARPLIRNVSGESSFIVDGATGTVTIRGLDFEQAQPAQLSIWSPSHNADQLIVDDCTFEITASGRGVDVDFGGSSQTLVSNSRFHGGEVAVFAHQSHMDVRNSTMSGSSWGGMQYQMGARGVFENSEVTNCGIVGCVRAVVDSDVDIRNNHFEDHRTNGNEFNHSLITVSTRANVRITNNRIDGCGFGQCITVLNRAVVTIAQNEFHLPATDHVRFAIIGSDGFLGRYNNFANYSPDLTITDNKIIGVGSNPVGNRWAIMYAAIGLENGAIGHIHGNYIENAGAAFQTDLYPLNGATSGLLGGNIADGSDNVVNDVVNPILAWGGENRINLHSSNFTNYLYGVSVYQSNNVVDVTCNWWGSASGPHDNFAPASTYTPWATAPVAGTNATCN